MSQELSRHQFEHIARHYIGMAEFSGFHSTGGVWVYTHNIVNNAWKMWQEFQKLSDARLADSEVEIRAEYMQISPVDETIRTQQATIDRLTEQRDRLFKFIKDFDADSYIQPVYSADFCATTCEIKERATQLIAEIEGHNKYAGDE